MAPAGRNRAEALQRAGQRVRTVQGLQDEFVNRWFPGGDAYDSDVLRLHDAAHQFANVSPQPGVGGNRNT